MKTDILSKSGDKTGKKVDLNKDVFGVEPNEHCIYLAVKSEMASLHQGTHSSKTRGEVRGGGAKPWKQKGTGRARVGSSRNPSRVHGGSAFGPKPHSYTSKINKKVKSLARKSALSKKFAEKQLLVIDDISFETPKTKEFITVLSNLNLTGKKITILTNDIGENLWLSSRNAKNVTVIPAGKASTYDIMDCQTLLLDKAGVAALNTQLAG
jgi:large subunit ribosomal protein L4